MKAFTSLFTAHPASVGETYLQHLASASRYSLRMIGAGICCLVHGVLPFLFVKTGSAAVSALHDRMVVNRPRIPGARPGVASTTSSIVNAG